jgi:regulatory protein
VPRVTALRDRGARVEVDLDGAVWRTLPVEAVARSGLAVGRVLDRTLARTLARELRRSRALRAATRMLSTRDVSKAALQARLARGSIAPAARAEALRTLEEAGLLDDERFAAGRARALAGRGYGDAAIRSDLEQKGVAPELLEAALAELVTESERARAIATRRGRTSATARYLARRGFGLDAVAEAVGTLVAGDD